MSNPRVLVTFSPPPDVRAAVLVTLSPLADVGYLADLDADARAGALMSSDVVLAWGIDRELRTHAELELLRSVGLVQLIAAGVDEVPFDRLPAGVPVASNAGAFAEPIAEHVLAMVLALAKRLPQNHAALARGEFDPSTPNRRLRGSLVGILGFGGIGQACARVFRSLGARVHAINRSGRTDQPVDDIGTLVDLDSLLAAVDVLVICLPLTRETRGLVARRELALMKTGAILVNVARADLLNENALYEHLRGNPAFSAAIDTWWQEPDIYSAERESSAFTTRRPFFELPNVLGSPHNSAITVGSLPDAARHAAENVARYLRGEPVRNLVDRAEYLG